jgi:uncharacterized membrane protein HdeD (DUF308 family)
MAPVRRLRAMRMAPLVRNWWMMATRGALAMAFGAVLSLWPNATLPVVVVVFAVYAILDGAWAIGAATWASERGRRFETWPVALEGLVSVGIGAVALLWPFVPRTFVHIVAVWGIVTGALELLTALAVPRERAAHWLMGTSGVCSIFLAVLVLLIPLADEASVVSLIAAYAIVFGVVTMSAAVRFRDTHPIPRLERS